jgi:hypothetical protein
MRSKCEGYTLENDGLFQFGGRMYVLENDDIRILVMEEAHRSPYFAHLGVNKMHVVLKLLFWG